MCWWLQDKWLLIFESHGDSNRCTLCRRNLIHTTRMLPISVHICYSYVFYGQFPYVITSHAEPTKLVGCTAPEKKCSRLHLLARLSGPQDLPQFLSQHNHWSSALKINIYWQTCYIDLLGSYLLHVFSTFNTYLWMPTHRSLTGTYGDYNLESASFPHHSPRPFQPTALRFPPMGPVRSLFNQLPKYPTINVDIS
jgi:hypothetical protein